MLNVELHSILKETFGHKSFRNNQLKIIKSILNGHDTLAIMPTGGGKSLCYQIPALYLEGITLVISPLISLMQDQVMGLEAHGVKSAYLNSSQSYEERQEVEQQILDGEVKIVYVSPEGLLSGYLLNFFENLDISLIAIDEAHCVSQWGHEFREDYRRLGELKDSFVDTPILALTATADSKTRLDICQQLRMKEHRIYISSFDRPNITYQIYERSDELKQLQSFIEKEHRGETGIVYCLSRKKVEKVAKELRLRGFNAHPYHAGLSSSKRASVQKKFNRQDSIIIVATIAFGMGIDRPDVRFVAHLDLPKSVESYYQETGRAGRDGGKSNAWMVYGLQDVIKLSQMLETTDASESYKKVARHKLDSMLSLCETTRCRRQYLLNYFEEELEKNCGNCDSCLEPGEVWDATVDAQKILSVIYKTGQIFGAGHLIDVIRGSQNQKVLSKAHHKLSVYGIGKDQTSTHWNTILRQLLNLGYVKIQNWDYRNLVLTQKSIEILKAQSTLTLRKTKLKKTKAQTGLRIKEQEHGRNDLFQDLRELRKEIAEESKIPPYLVFGDRSLHDMCTLIPRNRDEFLLVNGVGQSKCEKYADLFLTRIKRYQDASSLVTEM